MNLLDKYVAAVGKNLPGKNRQDIEAELHSTLEDMLEDRSQQSGRPVDDAMVAELLKEYGAPDKVAAGYGPTRYLIGPRLFPMFEMVLKIVWTVLFAVSLFSFAISFSAHPEGAGFISSLGQFFMQLIMGLITAFGNIVIIFAILERTLPASEFEDEHKEWDPAQLDKEPDPQRVKPAELIVGILFTAAALVIFNLYPEVIGVGFMTEGRWTFVPLLSQAFFSYLPWINLLSVLQIVLNLVLLRQGTWQIATRLFNIALDIAGIVLAYAMLTGPSLVNLAPTTLTGTPIAEAWDVLQRLFPILPLMVLAIIIITQGVEVAQNIYRLVSGKVVKIPLPNRRS